MARKPRKVETGVLHVSDEEFEENMDELEQAVKDVGQIEVAVRHGNTIRLVKKSPKVTVEKGS